MKKRGPGPGSPAQAIAISGPRRLTQALGPTCISELSHCYNVDMMAETFTFTLDHDDKDILKKLEEAWVPDDFRDLPLRSIGLPASR